MTDGTAIISDDGVYRYVLTRRIPSALRWVRPMLFVMLNPSKATAEEDDPTIRVCIDFATRESCTSLTVVNLFALRSTDPKQLLAHPDPIGPENDRHFREQWDQHAKIGFVILAWGAHAAVEKLKPKIIEDIRFAGGAWCLGVTKDGSPRHPLYIKRTQPLVRWPAA